MNAVAAAVACSACCQSWACAPAGVRVGTACTQNQVLRGAACRVCTSSQGWWPHGNLEHTLRISFVPHLAEDALGDLVQREDGEGLSKAQRAARLRQSRAGGAQLTPRATPMGNRSCSAAATVPPAHVHASTARPLTVSLPGPAQGLPRSAGGTGRLRAAPWPSSPAPGSCGECKTAGREGLPAPRATPLPTTHCVSPPMAHFTPTARPTARSTLTS